MAAKKGATRKAVAAAAPAKRGKAVEARGTSKTAAPAKKAKKKATASTSVAKARATRTPVPKAAKPAKPAKKVALTPASSPGGLGVGDRAPSFALLDHRGESLSSDELAGKPYVVYFYPKDDTPGCTTEACGFRDTVAEFADLGVRIVGVSPDSVASHQRFVSKYGLPFTLLSDPEQALASSYGVWALKKNYGREYMGIVRSTFLVDAGGVIRKAWRSVRVNGHVAEVQAAAAALS
jgi:peroxiredoxin Q/BCP